MNRPGRATTAAWGARGRAIQPDGQVGFDGLAG